jgi:phage shock protein C
MTEPTSPTPSSPTPSSRTPSSRTPKRLVRSRSDRWLSGVCGGLAGYLGVNANLVRLVVVLGTVFGFGSLALAYLVAWVLMPEE